MDWDTDAQGVYGSDPAALEVCDLFLYADPRYLNGNH
jgi:hypothetical protein